MAVGLGDYREDVYGLPMRLPFMHSTFSLSRSFVLISRVKHYRRHKDAQHAVRIAFRPGCSLFSTSAARNGERNVQPAKHVEPLLRRCLVTGGASGIGYEVTKQLLLNGVSSVTITSRNSQKAQLAIDQIKADIGYAEAPLHFIECDFQKTISFEALAPEGQESHSDRKFDTLINCAGITQSQGLLSTPSKSTSMILKTNLEAPIELSRGLLKNYFSLGKQLRKQDPTGSDLIHSYCVVNISSLLAQRGGYGTSIYSTSKAGLIAFTRTLALEAAAVRDKFPSLPPFRANVVVPGYIDTPMIENFSDQQKQKLESQIPLRRYGTAAEVAEAVIFLLRNEYANNTVLNLDGGLSAT